MTTIVHLLGTDNVGNSITPINNNFDSLNTNKVEVVAGKQLSTEDYSTAEKSKLAGIAAGAEVNNISNVNATDLTDGGASTLHYHASDRDLANSTGTLAILNGGTGQTTAQLAINALTAVSGATNEHVLTKDTATGNAVFKAVPAGTFSPFGIETLYPRRTVAYNVDGLPETISFPDVPITYTFTHGIYGPETVTDGVTTKTYIYDSEGRFIDLT